jgi:Calpain family cysteine protease
MAIPTSIRWASNPIALARLALSGAQEQPWPDSWEAVERLLGAAYKTSGISTKPSDGLLAVFYGSGDAPALIDLLQQAADQVPEPLPLASIRGLPAVRALADRLANPEWLSRLLPFIVPVSDVGFGPGAEVAMTEHPKIGSYEHIGSLDVGGVSWLDPEQGSTADCYLISAMISIAWARPRTWRKALSNATLGSRDTETLEVAFHAENEGDRNPHPFKVPSRVPLDAHHNWIYAHSANHAETWPALVERAFVMQVRHRTKAEPTVDDYREIGNGMFPHEAARVLIGGSPVFNVADAHDKPFEMVADRCENSLTKAPTMAWTLPKPDDDRAAPTIWVESKLIRNHAYAVLGLMVESGNNFVVLRNPFGNNDRIADSPGGHWAKGAVRNGGAPVSLNHNGVFAISEKRFNACFTGVDGVDLPGN